MPLDPRLFPRVAEQADTPILSMDVRSFRGGMVDKVHPTSLELDEAVLLSNILLKQGALAEKRAGSSNVMSAPVLPSGNVNGLGFWNPPEVVSSRRLLSSSQNGFHDWTGSGDWRLLTGGILAGDEPVYFVQGNELEPTFASKVWIFQKDATEVLEYDGTGTLSVVSGELSGLENSVPTGTSAVYWLGRLWVAADGLQNGNIFYSEFGRPTVFDLSKGFLVNPNDPVTRIVQWFNTGIIVFQRNSIWALDIDQGNFEEFLFDSTRMEMLNDDIGCIAGNSVAQSGQDFFFLSRFGVMQLSKTARDRSVGRAIPISDPIEGTIQRINWSAADKATGIHWDNLYLLAVPIDGSLTNNAVLVWDIRETAWTIIEGWDVGDWEIANFPISEDRLYFGTSDIGATGEVYEAFDDASELDDADPIVGVIQTPRYDFGTTDRRKQMRYLDVFTDAGSGGDMEVYAAPDNQDFVLLGTINVSSGQLLLPFFLPARLGGAVLQRDRFPLDQFEGVLEIQFQFRMIDTGQTRLLYLTLSGQPDEQQWS